MPPSDTPPAIAPAPRRRPPMKAALMLLRRGHLYAGLLLLPWVLMYGVTAFLFNHPTAFSEQQAVSFGRGDLIGTLMENVPSARDTAAQVVAALKERTPGADYALAEPDHAAFSRDNAFATVKADGQDISLLFDATGTGGSIRVRPAAIPKPTGPPAPFAVGREGGGVPKKGGREGGKDENRPARTGDGLKLPETMADRVKAAVPAVLERLGLPTGDVTVTSVPDVTFLMTADGKLWKATYNPMTGAVSGKPADQEAGDSISVRRFLTSLHVAHGYPASANARWVWAVIVDAMAVIMLFWGISGLFMWWQIKATRRWGAAALLVSLVAAVVIGFGMHEAFTSR